MAAHTPHPLRRRTLGAALIVMPALWLGARAQQPAAARRFLTPSQTEGPFYPVELPADSDPDLLHNGGRAPYRGGQPAWVDGTVSDTEGRPVAGAQVEIWQCDEHGHYHHPGDGNRADAAFQGFGRVTAGADGRYRFRTIRPVPYSGRTPHIHVKVKLGSRELLTTQLYVEGDPGNARDGIWRRLDDASRAAVTVPFERGSDGLQARFPIVVAA
ncbi:intradiol ring-cleavage dioxygenase [Variovorax sp. RT4R15]|uniref:dioxygenase family protein n=1 Tax=Variovorax sp. RT4R15 TaxID=3443737 RepID=UPI003F478686